MAHEQIWAPWRLGYILGDKKLPEPEKPLELLPGADPECFLCQCVGDSNDRERLTVQRGERVITVLNRYPYNNGHLLVSPQKHHSRLDQLDEPTQIEIARMITRMVAVLEKAISPQGFNIGLNLGEASGAGLPGHLHWHVVPRWNGDTNFMPSVAGIHVIPQSLEALWELVSGELAKS
ncbi:MAG: HIT domain-containing protein [Thermoguttaceae bacterium]